MQIDKSVQLYHETMKIKISIVFNTITWSWNWHKWWPSCNSGKNSMWVERLFWKQGKLNCKDGCFEL